MKTCFVTIGIGAALLAQAALCATIGAAFSTEVSQKPTRKSVTYGPFTIPAAGAGKGASTAMPSKSNIELPCKDCTYTYLRGDMVDEAGRTIERSAGAYLHHLMVISPRDKDSAPVSGFSSTLMFKPIYLTGEERIAINYPGAGVYVHPSQPVTMSAMIQNRAAKAAKVWIKMDYEYLPGKPNGYLDLIPISQDALGFGGPPRGQQSFTKVSSGFTSPYDGKILMVNGHLHDGGIHTEIMINNKVICDSIAYYDDMPIPPGLLTSTGHSHDKRDGPGGKRHIKAFGECRDTGYIKKGDVITTKIYYDFSKRQRDTMDNGAPADLMGISMVYIGIEMSK